MQTDAVLVHSFRLRRFARRVYCLRNLMVTILDILKCIKLLSSIPKSTKHAY